MASSSFNTASTSALRSLQATSQAMNEAQTRISTGLKINSAKDNAYVWKVSQSLRSDIDTTSSIQDNMTVAKAVADKTSVAVTSIREILGKMKDTVDAAGVAGANKASLQVDMAGYISQLKAVVASGGLNGTNYLTGTAVSDVIIGKDSAGANLTTTLTNTDLKMIGSAGGLLDTLGTFDKTGSAKGSILDLDVTSATGTLAQATTDLAAVITKADAVVANVASYSKRLESQSDYLNKISDIQKSTLSTLVDADLNEESAKLSALQVRQQLAATALSIINQSQTNILRLFQ